MNHSGGSGRAHFNKGGSKNFDRIVRIHADKIAPFAPVDIDLSEIEDGLFHIHR
jgi:hypothetical protein